MLCPRWVVLISLKKIKQYNAFIQVIMITGYTTVSNILNVFRSGAIEVIENWKSVMGKAGIAKGS